MAPKYRQFKKIALMNLFIIAAVCGPYMFAQFSAPGPETLFIQSKFLQDKLFIKSVRTGSPEIDAVILGGTTSAKNISAPNVISKFEQAGRTGLSLYNFSAFYSGPAYMLAQTEVLLARKKVSFLFIELSKKAKQEQFGPLIFYWWQNKYWNREASLLPLNDRLWYYAESIIGLPLQLWSLVFPHSDFEINPIWTERAEKIAEGRGTSPGLHNDFPATAEKDWQLDQASAVFLKETVELARSKGTQVIFFTFNQSSPANFAENFSGLPVIQLDSAKADEDFTAQLMSLVGHPK